MQKAGLGTICHVQQSLNAQEVRAMAFPVRKLEKPLQIKKLLGHCTSSLLLFFKILWFIMIECYLQNILAGVLEEKPRHLSQMNWPGLMLAGLTPL